MKRKIVLGTTLTLLFIGMLTFAFGIHLVKADPWIWTVDDDGPADFSSIQEAINAASPGDTIYVYNGTYYERVVVNKSVSLVGENRITTIVDGGLQTGFCVTTDYVNISGFTIRNCGPSEGGTYAGVHLDSSDNCTISGNIMNDNYMGIWPDSSSNNTIFNNTFSNCSIAIGGAFMSGNKQKIFNNFISDNTAGIYLQSSGKSIISNNTILNSRDFGIYLQSCWNNILTNNNMTDNIYSLRVFGLSLSYFIHDIDVSNTVDGKAVYYLINQRNLIIDPLAFPDVGYLGLVNSTNIIIKNLTLTRSGQGLLLAYITRSTVMHMNISFNNRGIEMFGSINNTIIDNTIMSNHYGGIELSNCNSNTISNNMISNNRLSAISMIWSDSNIIRCNTLSKNDYGIHLLFYHGNIIYGNTISENDIGIDITQSSDNIIYHNNFIDNGDQVNLIQSTNTWDNGYPSGGNYWSDYTYVDLYSGPYQNEMGIDGIWDHPYVIDQNDQDNYPLVNPWALTSKIDILIKGGENAIIEGNVTLTHAVVTWKILHFDASGPTESIGWINVTFPMVNTTEIKVKIDGEEPNPPFPVINTNGTHYFIYFEFTLSTHTITIQFASPVGGIYIPVNKLELLAPYIGLAVLLIVAVISVGYVKKRKRDREL